MPDKEGSDDEKKSTKSVVNKKQKQMMGEEGYDIARDMGKVRPSKDKKDATTMPPSKEMKKTQKVNKGPSAFERVKAKYGKSVMNVGKKKANEELDLTQVAEAFGGYIIEISDEMRQRAFRKSLEKRDKAKRSGDSTEVEKRERQVRKFANQSVKDRRYKQKGIKDLEQLSGQSAFAGQSNKQAQADAESDMTQDAAAADIRKTGQKFRRPVSGTPQAKGYKPKGKIKLGDTTIGGPVKIVAKKGEAKAQRDLIKRFNEKERQTPNIEKPLVRPASPAFVDPKSDPFSDRFTRQYAADSGAPAFKQPPLPDPKTGPASKIDPQPTRKKRTARTYKASSPERRDARIAAVKAGIDKRNPTFTSPVTGGQLPVGGADDYQRRLSRAYGQSLKGTIKTGQFPAGSPLPPASQKPPEEPKPQKDQQQQQTFKDFNKELDKITDPYQRIVQFYKNQGKEVPERFKKKAETGQLGGGAGRSGGGGKGGSGGGGKGGSGGGGLSNTGGPLVPKGGALDKPKEPKGSVVSNSLEKVKNFARENPVAALAAYDIGKGVLGKILKVKSFAPGVVGGTVGRRSARGGGGL